MAAVLRTTVDQVGLLLYLWKRSRCKEKVDLQGAGTGPLPGLFPCPHYSAIFRSTCTLKTALRPMAAYAISRIHRAAKWCRQVGFLENVSGLEVLARHFLLTSFL